MGAGGAPPVFGEVVDLRGVGLPSLHNWKVPEWAYPQVPMGVEIVVVSVVVCVEPVGWV
jgi:hypothetical protein